MTLAEKSRVRDPAQDHPGDEDVTGHVAGFYDPDAAAFDEAEQRLLEDRQAEDDGRDFVDGN